MYKILVFNNSYSEYNLLKVLISYNDVEVYTIGKIKPHFTCNIKHIKIDYTDVQKIKDLIKKYQINYLLPCANDLSLFSIMTIDRGKKHDKSKIVKILHDKKKFRTFENQHFKDAIKYSSSNKLVDVKKLNFPILMKPMSGSGGKGIKKLDHINEFKELTKKEKSNSLFEEFVKGTNHGIFTIIKNKKLFFLFIDTEQRFLNEFTVSSTNNSHPLNNYQIEKFKKKVNGISQKLNIVDGILHFQVKFYKKQIKIVEVTRRLPGDSYLKFLELSTGFPVIKNIINIYLGMKPIKSQSGKANILRKVVMAHKNGTLKNILIHKKIKKYIVWEYNIRLIGEEINDYLNQRISIVMFKFNTKKEMLTCTSQIDNLVRTSIE
tara:strand:+ start:317 stop:1447 length:1131 start_codon:yes stop_codon:yes gene_type:complete